MECLATVHFLAAEDSTRFSTTGGRRRLYLPTSDQFAEWQNRGRCLGSSQYCCRRQSALYLNEEQRIDVLLMLNGAVSRKQFGSKLKAACYLCTYEAQLSGNEE
jgi:hypothetical protein